MKKIEEIKLLLNLNEFSTHKGFPNERNDVMVDKTIFYSWGPTSCFFQNKLYKVKTEKFSKKEKSDRE